MLTQRETVKAETEVVAVELGRRQTKGNLIKLSGVVITCRS